MWMKVYRNANIKYNVHVRDAYIFKAHSYTEFGIDQIPNSIGL